MKHSCSWKTERGTACRNWAVRWDGEIPAWHVHACSSHFVEANNYYAIQRRKRLVWLGDAMEEIGMDSGKAELLFAAMERRVGLFNG